MVNQIGMAPYTCEERHLHGWTQASRCCELSAEGFPSSNGRVREVDGSVWRTRIEVHCTKSSPRGMWNYSQLPWREHISCKWRIAQCLASKGQATFAKERSWQAHSCICIHKPWDWAPHLCRQFWIHPWLNEDYLSWVPRRCMVGYWPTSCPDGRCCWGLRAFASRETGTLHFRPILHPCIFTPWCT